MFWPILLVVVGLFFTKFGVILKDHVVYWASLLQDRKVYKPLATQYSSKARIIVSLTSSPVRIKKGISESLRIFTKYDNVQVHLQLPKLFRNEEAYDEEALVQLQNDVPNLKIIWHPKDLGPQLKLLGALESVQDPNAFIVVLDDDVAYANNLLVAYDRAFQKEAQNIVYAAKVESIYGIPITPGFASFAIQRASLPPNFKDMVERRALADASCKRHDDFLFGSIFQDFQFQTVHVKVKGPLSLPIGFGLDALHTSELIAVKHYTCSKGIWNQRSMCPRDYTTSLLL